MAADLVLSIFPGVDLLGRAFEEEGWCLVRGPDVLWGGDVRTFHPPAGVFAGVIGGPPCQCFTPLAGINRALGREPRFGDLIPEFARVCLEAQPEWWLMENVERAPLPEVAGYQVAPIVLDNRWLGEEQARRRRFCFGTRDGRALTIDGLVALEHPNREPAVVSTTGWLLGNGNGYQKSRAAVDRITESRRRPLERLADLQGLPGDFLADAPFTAAGKRRVIANGVPLPMGRAIAKAIRRALTNGETCRRQSARHSG